MPETVGPTRFKSSYERRRETTKPEGYRGMEGRVPEPRKAPKASGQFAESYEEDWTDWPTKLARSISDSFVNRFGGSNISRREMTNELLGAEELALSPATGATKAYRAARSGRYGDVAKQAGESLVENLPVGKALKGAGFFISPFALNKIKGAEGTGSDLWAAAQRIRREGGNDADVRRRTRLSFLRNYGDDPANVVPAFEMGTKSLLLNPNPDFLRMHDVDDMRRLFQDRAAFADYPRLKDVFSHSGFEQAVTGRGSNLPVFINEENAEPLQTIWGPLGNPIGASINPSTWGQEGRALRNPSQFQPDELVNPKIDPTLYSTGRTMQELAAFESGWPTGVDPTQFVGMTGEAIREMPPTYMSSSPETARIMEGLWDQFPTETERIPAAAFNKTVGESTGQLGGISMGLDQPEMLNYGPDERMEAMGLTPSVDQLDPDILAHFAEGWKGTTEAQQNKALQDWFKYRLSAFDRKAGGLF